MLEKELGSEAVKRIRSPNIVLDILLVTVYPLLAWVSTYVMWISPVSTLAYWVAAVCGGWLALACPLVMHDVVGHRSAFGKWGSWIVGLWVTSGSPMVINGMNTLWVARHRIHHRHTFEQKDPELYRNKLADRVDRVLGLFGPYRLFWRRKIYAKYNAGLDVEKEFPGTLGREYAFKIKVERWLMRGTNWTWLALLCMHTHPALRTIMGALGFLGVFETLRYILEHGEQDIHNPFWQATFYDMGIVTELISLWGGGKYHAVHHIWADVPVYRMPEAGRLIKPILIRQGVKLRTDFWALAWAYLVDGKQHADKWFEDQPKSGKIAAS